jgi:hypothetical protein
MNIRARTDGQVKALDHRQPGKSCHETIHSKLKHQHEVKKRMCT